MKRSFSREDSPRRKLTRDAGTPIASASSRQTASLALPLSGTACTRMRNTSPDQPSTLLQRARGVTRTLRYATLGASLPALRPGRVLIL